MQRLIYILVTSMKINYGSVAIDLPAAEIQYFNQNAMGSLNYPIGSSPSARDHPGDS